jgi:hypothetical protein
LLVILAAACGGEESREPVDGGTALDLAVHPESWGGDGMAALVGGKVGLDEGSGCVVLGDEERSIRVVWPLGTSAQRDPFRIVLPDGTVVREGMWVEGGGGFLDQETLDGLEIRHECLSGSEIAVFNADETLVVNESGEPIVHPAPQAMVPFTPSGSDLTGLTESIEGVVELRVETGCALLAANGALYAVAWPRSTRGELDPFRLTLPDGTVVHEGDTIRGQGDVFAPDNLRAFDGFPECAWDPESEQVLEEAWAFNHDETVEVVDP